MKILFTRFPLESRLGGAEAQTIALMKGLSGHGRAVAFLGSCPILLREIANCQLPTATLEIGPPPVTKWNAVSFLWRKQRMQQRLEAALEAFHDLDAIFMLSLSEKLLLTEAAVRKGIRVFWMEHDRVGPWLTRNPWLPRLRALSQSVTTVCVSELSRKIYLDLGWRSEDVIAIPNGIDVSRFAAENANRQTPTDKLTIGCVARLSPEKGVDILVKAVTDLPDIHLTIVGTGPQEYFLKSLLTRNITMVPCINDLAAFYRSIDVLILPSRDNDPFGLVAAEAMACGTPVIVTDQCGIAGYLRDHEDALIVPANSERALREAVLQATDRSLRQRLSEAGKSSAEQKFALSVMTDAYERLLHV